VANCQPETTEAITARENTKDKYRGNVSKSNCGVGGGGSRWAGLFKDELDSNLPPFQTRYWSGIDCSGLVQRSVDRGRYIDDEYGLPGLNIEIPSLLTKDALNSKSFLRDQEYIT
jgi:hypothetical protein